MFYFIKDEPISLVTFDISIWCFLIIILELFFGIHGLRLWFLTATITFGGHVAFNRFHKSLVLLLYHWNFVNEGLHELVSLSQFGFTDVIFYTCCDACGRLFVKLNYCPVCPKVLIVVLAIFVGSMSRIWVVRQIYIQSLADWIISHDFGYAIWIIWSPWFLKYNFKFVGQITCSK